MMPRNRTGLLLFVVLSVTASAATAEFLKGATADRVKGNRRLPYYPQPPVGPPGKGAGPPGKGVEPPGKGAKSKKGGSKGSDPCYGKGKGKGLGEECGKGSMPYPPSGKGSYPPLTYDSVVFNAYIIHNMVGLTAKDLQYGKNRMALDHGYMSYVVNEFATFVHWLQSYSRRDLLGEKEAGRDLQAWSIELKEKTIQTYYIEDVDCPAGLTGNCQKVYGAFEICTTGILTPEKIVEALTQQTQANIAKEPYGMNYYILSFWPLADIRVIMGSYPLRPPIPVLPPSRAPVLKPTAAPQKTSAPVAKTVAPSKAPAPGTKAPSVTTTAPTPGTTAPTPGGTTPAPTATPGTTPAPTSAPVPGVVTPAPSAFTLPPVLPPAPLTPTTPAPSPGTTAPSFPPGTPTTPAPSPSGGTLAPNSGSAAPTPAAAPTAPTPAVPTTTAPVPATPTTASPTPGGGTTAPDSGSVAPTPAVAPTAPTPAVPTTTAPSGSGPSAPAAPSATAAPSASGSPVAPAAPSASSAPTSAGPAAPAVPTAGSAAPTSGAPAAPSASSSPSSGGPIAPTAITTPTTVAPTTSAPGTSAAPTTSSPGTSAAPTTSAPGTTSAPTTAGASAAPTTAVQRSEENNSGSASESVGKQAGVAAGIGVAGVAVLVVGGLLFARYHRKGDGEDGMKASTANLDTLSLSHDTRTNDWFEDQSSSTPAGAPPPQLQNPAELQPDDVKGTASNASAWSKDHTAADDQESAI